jgi:hypothetical protein
MARGKIEQTTAGSRPKGALVTASQRVRDSEIADGEDCHELGPPVDLESNSSNPKPKQMV